MQRIEYRRTRYTVRARDTLQRIARKTKARGGWRGIVADNSFIHCPDLIWPGDTLTLYVPVVVDEPEILKTQTTMVSDGSLIMRAVEEPTTFI